MTRSEYEYQLMTVLYQSDTIPEKAEIDEEVFDEIEEAANGK